MSLIVPEHARHLTGQQVAVLQVGMQAWRDAIIAACPSRRAMHVPVVTLVGWTVYAAIEARRTRETE